MSTRLILVILLFGVAVAARGQSPLEKHDIHSLALLPAIGDAVPETVRDLLTGELKSQLEKQFPKLKIKTTADSLSALSQAGELNDFGNLVNLYTKTGVIDSGAAGRIAKAMDVESILLINFQEYEAQNGSWLRARNGHNSVRAQCHLLNSHGETIWHHLVAYVHTPQWTAKADPAKDVTERVAKRVVYALSRGIENTDPKKDIKP
jgi:hypothetical protein